jgi:superfamily II DNA or RNA helicase
MNPEWKAYELHAMQHHAKKHGHQVWHASDVPEAELQASGILHDFNRAWLLRIAAQRRANGNTTNLFSDYGMDFLAKGTNPDGTASYHACQVKYRTTSGWITADELGSFQSVVIQTGCPGYLYTNGSLDRRIKTDMLNSIHKQLPSRVYTEYLAPGRGGDVAPGTEESEESESNCPLRPYQVEATDALVDALAGHSVSVLSMGCGLGKTVVIGHVLRELQPHRVICTAPLRVSVDNLRKRLKHFLPTHAVMLVDSDVGGTTDVHDLARVWTQDGPVIVYTTFKSAVDVLSVCAEVDATKTMLVIDEVHNVVNRRSMCEFVNRFPTALLASATVPQELYTVIPDAALTYNYSMQDGIRDGFICNYKVHFPSGVVNADDLDSKAHFIAAGLLQTGSRRCIVYLEQTSEAADFLKAVTTVLADYHGMSCWSQTIIHKTNENPRQTYLKHFQHDTTHDVYLLASVQILDEAVDVPRCDSVFIARVRDNSSDIRMVQRLQRGCRKDPDNPDKVNNMFLWMMDPTADMECLKLMQSHDPAFHTKLHALSSDCGSHGKRVHISDESAIAIKRSIAPPVSIITMEPNAPEPKDDANAPAKNKSKAKAKAEQATTYDNVQRGLPPGIKTTDYMCPRCGFYSNSKHNIRSHFQRKKPCESTLSDVILDDYITEYVLANRRFYNRVNGPRPPIIAAGLPIMR